MTLAGFVHEHPYRSSFGFLLVVTVVVLIVGLLNERFLMGSLVQVAVVDLLLAIIGIFLLTRLNWWGTAGYTAGIRLSHVPLFILPVTVGLVSLGQGIRVTAPLVILAFAALTLLVGFAEETFFRGLILTSLLPAGTIRAVALSSFFFAAPHLLNVIGGTWDPAFTIVDSIAAFGLGVTFAAIRLRTGSIWPLVGIHALFDFTSLVALGGVEVPAQSPQTLLASVVVGIVFVLYGLFLLRNDLSSGTPAANA
ncbi:MAG: CPBP family intramembrane glutamic endopeptidase [Methanoregula sp.]|jgi:membrane protease YdiL (CAAX protease family)|uniref:CPBP family intramembrane glutamic endopeptidase n=1 Tax=Methanoregula sp. TaxID=2052170 RepID=UPI003C74AEDD